MLYFNCAATALQRPACVEEAVVYAMRHYGSAGRGSSEAELGPARCILDTRRRLAELFGSDSPERVIFTSNATEALNTVLFGVLSPGDHVLYTDWDHNSVIRPLNMLAAAGVRTDRLQADRTGAIDPEDIRRLVRPETKMIVCTHASNVTGDIADIGRIGQIAKEYGLLFTVDCAQTAGELPVDMRRMRIDFLCFTGHKAMMGPTGTGGILLGRDTDIRPLKAGGTGVFSFAPFQPDAYPAHLEAGTLNIHGIAGLGAAAGFLLSEGIGEIHDRTARLAERFLRGLAGTAGLEVYGTAGVFLRRLESGTDSAVLPERAPVVSLNIAGLRADETALILEERYGMSVRSGIHCAPNMHRALGTEERGTVRFSFGYYNTPEEADAAAEAVKEIAACAG